MLAAVSLDLFHRAGSSVDSGEGSAMGVAAAGAVAFAASAFVAGDKAETVGRAVGTNLSTGVGCPGEAERRPPNSPARQLARSKSAPTMNMTAPAKAMLGGHTLFRRPIAPCPLSSFIATPTLEGPRRSRCCSIPDASSVS